MGGALAGELETLERLYGPGDLVTVTGNGRLTVGANARGQVNLCRWPGPGANDHLSYQSVSKEGPGLNHGLQWGLRMGEDLLWLTDEAWDLSQGYAHVATTVMKTEGRLRDSAVSVEQTLFVHPETDLLVVRLAVTGLEEPPAFYWFANFTPCTRRLPELPVADWALDGLNDFAAFALPESQTVYHFRPAAPGALDWERAERLADAPPLASQWASFEDGVWVAYSSFETMAAQHCGSGDETPSKAVLRHLDRGQGRTGATGSCYSVVEIVPRKEGGAFVATVVAGFGKDLETAERILRGGLDTGYDALLDSTVNHWYTWLLDAGVPPETEFETITLMMRCLLTLATVTDRETGAMVRSPSTQPPLARDWVRHGMWMTYALDLAGYRAMAERHLLSYLDVVRTTGRRGGPRGSLPAARYAGGGDASPHAILDLRGAAWLLWSFSQHSTFLDAESRERFLNEVWEGVSLTADFVAEWADGRRGRPLHSFDPVRLRDTRSADLLVTSHLGLESAIGIAETLGKTPPEEWTRRKKQLDVLLRVRGLDEELTWGLEDPLPFSLGEILSEDDPRFERSVRARLEALPGLRGHAAAKALCEVVMLWRRNPAKLAELEPYIGPALERALTAPRSGGADGGRWPAFPDALTAALCYISAFTVLGAAS